MVSVERSSSTTAAAAKIPEHTTWHTCHGCCIPGIPGISVKSVDFANPSTGTQQVEYR